MLVVSQCVLAIRLLDDKLKLADRWAFLRPWCGRLVLSLKAEPVGVVVDGGGLRSFCDALVLLAMAADISFSEFKHVLS